MSNSNLYPSIMLVPSCMTRSLGRTKQEKSGGDTYVRSFELLYLIYLVNRLPIYSRAIGMYRKVKGIIPFCRKLTANYNKNKTSSQSFPTLHTQKCM